mgnify:CR=1 FL=1
MDWGIIATVIGGVIAALFTWRGVRDKNKTDTRAAELDKLLKGMGDEISRLKADVESLKTVLAATATERDTLRGVIRDQAELLDDWRAIGDWITGGAQPPIPTLSWRILQERADHERALERQRTNQKETP